MFWEKFWLCTSFLCIYIIAYLIYLLLKKSEKQQKTSELSRARFNEIIYLKFELETCKDLIKKKGKNENNS